MPIHGFRELRLPPPDKRARLDFMPGSTVPVIRQPFEPGDRVPFWAGAGVDEHYCFDIDVDPDEEENLVGTRVEREMLDLLREALREVAAPDDQYERLGIE